MPIMALKEQNSERGVHQVTCRACAVVGVCACRKPLVILKNQESEETCIICSRRCMCGSGPVCMCVFACDLGLQAHKGMSCVIFKEQDEADAVRIVWTAVQIILTASSGPESPSHPHLGLISVMGPHASLKVPCPWEAAESHTFYVCGEAVCAALPTVAWAIPWDCHCPEHPCTHFPSRYRPNGAAEVLSLSSVWPMSLKPCLCHLFSPYQKP